MENVPAPAPEVADEPRTLAAARSLLADLRTAHANELAGLGEQLATAAAAADEAHAALTAANEQLVAVTAERDEFSANLNTSASALTAAETDLAAARETISRLESLAGVRGIPAAQAADAAPDGSNPVAQFEAASEARDWATVRQIFSDHKAAILAARRGR
jgi:chromosome segregation ATPase